MKILQWSASSTWDRGGRTNFVKDLADQITQLGHEIVWALTLEPSSGSSPQPEGNTLFLPSQELGTQIRQEEFADYATRLQEFLCQYRPDIVHCHKIGPIDSLVLSAATKPLGIPLVYTEHEAPTTGNDEFFAKRDTIFQRFSAIICPSEQSRSLLEGLFPSAAGKLVSIPNGVVTPDSPGTVFPPRSVFFSGRLSPEKGGEWLLDAWRIVLESEPDAKLTIAGEGSEAPILIEKTQHLGIESSVNWVGWLDRDASRALMGSHQLVVVPSIWQEPFGLVAAEASAAGRPAIVSEVGALRSIVVDGVTGIHVPPLDSTALASAILRLLKNPVTGEDMGRAGRARVLSEYSIPTCAKKHLDLYATITRDGGR